MESLRLITARNPNGRAEHHYDLTGKLFNRLRPALEPKRIKAANEATKSCGGVMA